MLYVSAIGAVVGIDLSALEQGDAAAVRMAWADAAAEAVERPAAVVVPRGDERSRMLQSLSRQVTQAAIDAGRSDLWMLHAAGIATPSGDVVAFVGPSGRGKTTAARQLGREYGYVSDETIAITRAGEVLPYRKPLSIIEQPRRPKVETRPSSLGLREVPSRLRVRAIVLLHRDPGHDGSPVVEAVDLGEALDDLVTQSSHLVERADALRFVAAVARSTGGIRRVRYREARDLPGIVPPLVSGSAAGLAIDPPVARDPLPASGGDGIIRYFRSDTVDELALAAPRRVAVLTRAGGGRGTVHVLAGIAPALWEAASGAPFDALVEAATAAHGAPDAGDAAAVVRAAVDRLVAEGLLHLGRSPAEGPEGLQA